LIIHRGTMYADGRMLLEKTRFFLWEIPI